MSPDREDTATGAPEAAAEMEQATQRLRDQAWKLSPLTSATSVMNDIEDHRRLAAG